MAKQRIIKLDVPKTKWTECRVSILGDGKAGLMFNAMGPQTLEVLRTGVRPQINKKEDPKKKAQRGLYKHGGKIGIPADCLWACLVEAGRHTKNGTPKISTRVDSTLPALLRVKGDFINLLTPTGRQVANKVGKGGWVVDIRKGNLPKDGTAVCLVRPKVREWRLDFVLLVDEDEVSIRTILELVRNAGKKVGLCEHRKKSPFGHFEVREFIAVNARKLDEESGKKPAVAKAADRQVAIPA